MSTNNISFELSEIEAGVFSFFEHSKHTPQDLIQAKNKISSAFNKYENEIKNTIMKNSDHIIKLFNHTKQIKEEFQKSRRNLESLESQILM